jgi:hypothetical protein
MAVDKDEQEPLQNHQSEANCQARRLEEKAKDQKTKQDVERKGEHLAQLSHEEPRLF